MNVSKDFHDMDPCDQLDSRSPAYSWNTDEDHWLLEQDEKDKLARHYDGPLPTVAIPDASPPVAGRGGQHSALHRATVEALGYNERRNCDPCARRAA